MCVCVFFDSFGGYGASISYSESLQKDKFSSTADTTAFTIELGFSTDIQLLVFSIGPTLSLSIGGSFTRSYTSTEDESSSKTRNRGFTLSDSDEYDVFDVEVS